MENKNCKMSINRAAQLVADLILLGSKHFGKLLRGVLPSGILKIENYCPGLKVPVSAISYFY